VTLREIIDAKYATIQKIENSQEYKQGLQSNRYVNYKDIVAEYKRYIELATACGRDDISEVEALSIVSGNGKRYVSF